MTIGTGHLTTRLGERAAPAKRRTRLSKTARLEPALAVPLGDLVRASPAPRGKPVVMTIDTAPWHRGRGSAEGLAAPPHLPL
jgi:hypothetical protein